MPSPRDHYAVLCMQCKALGLPAPIAEYRFHATRKWRFDFLIAPTYVIEIEGVVYATEPGDHRLGGRHTSRRGFAEDLAKYQAAYVLGYDVLRCLPSAIHDGSAALAIHARMHRGSRYDSPTVPPPTSDPLIPATRPARQASRAAARRAWADFVDRGTGPDAAPARAKRR
jgi:hypothetical protein